MDFSEIKLEGITLDSLPDTAVIAGSAMFRNPDLSHDARPHKFCGFKGTVEQVKDQLEKNGFFEKHNKALMGREGFLQIDSISLR